MAIGPHKKLGEPFRLTHAPFSPYAFNRRLEEVFGDRLRVRWSVRRGCWLIECKAARGTLAAPRRLADWDDSLIQARDGYAEVMRIEPGDRMPCAYCGRQLPVPHLESREVKCPDCLARNIDARWGTSYYPLGEVLIDHLKLIDPTRRAEVLDRIRAEEARDQRLRDEATASMAREGAAQFGDALRDQFPKAGFPSLTLPEWYH